MYLSRINNKLPLAKEGIPFVLGAFGVTFILMWLGLLIPCILSALLSLFIVFFFRDPERKTYQHDENTVLTPADGRVLSVEEFNNRENPLGEPAIKISIFMSIFNVHVNRIPIGGTINNIIYNPGKFFSANLEKASEQNENNRVCIDTGGSRFILVIQIAGLIARRIACWVSERDKVNTGQRFGLIRFGSRLEVYLPIDSRIIVQPNQKVKAGLTIIGYLS